MSDFHENAIGLSAEDKDIVRALISLKEEVEAINWYHQRISAADSHDLKELLIHNRDEEMEHACMAMEWLRRRMPSLDEAMRTYFFTDRPITEIEELEEAEETQHGGNSKKSDPGYGGIQIGDLKK